MRTRQGLWAAVVVAALLAVSPAAVAQPNGTAATETATQTPTSTVPETTVDPTEPTPDEPCNEGASVCPTNPCDADASTCPTEPCDPAASVCPTGPCEDYSCYAEPRLLVPDAVERGSSLTVSGDGWPCRIVEIAADWLSEPVVAVAAEGSFAATIAVGDDVALGEHGVTATQQGECDLSRSAGVVVLPGGNHGTTTTAADHHQRSRRATDGDRPADHRACCHHVDRTAHRFANPDRGPRPGPGPAADVVARPALALSAPRGRPAGRDTPRAASRPTAGRTQFRHRRRWPSRFRPAYPRVGRRRHRTECPRRCARRTDCHDTAPGATMKTIGITARSLLAASSSDEAKLEAFFVDHDASRTAITAAAPSTDHGSSCVASTHYSGGSTSS